MDLSHCTAAENQNSFGAMAEASIHRPRHRKSRYGCERCKRRKVKCDETRPNCDNCRKVGKRCHFNSIPPFSSTGSTAAQTDLHRCSCQSNAVLDSDAGSSKQKRNLELQLMHHYTLETSQEPFTGSHDPRVIHLYTRVVPVLALKYEPLLNAIFSIAALHLHKLHPTNKAYLDAHREYFETALKSQRHAVENINETNAEAVCLAATLITHASLVTSSLRSEYEPPWLWLDLMSNHHSLFKAAWDWVQEQHCDLVCVLEAEPNVREYWAQLRHPYPDVFPSDLDSIFPSILDFEDSLEVVDAERRSTYKFVLGYIAHSLQFIEAKEDPRKTRRRLLAFCALVPSKYKDLVRQRHPRALAIFSYYFSVVKAVDNVWWLRGIPEREVFGIQHMLPEHWQWAMAWPLQRLAFFGAAAINAEL